MLIFDKMNAAKIRYLLVSVDGTVEKSELERFDEVGAIIDPEHFQEYRDIVIEECNSYLEDIHEDDNRYDFIMEAVDEALTHRVETVDSGVVSRLLLWNLLVLAFADKKYPDEEKRFIRHIMRMTNTSRSVVLEMENLVKSIICVEDDLDVLSNSDMPYRKIRPLVDETEKRKKVLVDCATELIADEIVTPIEILEIEDDFMDVAQSAVGNTIDSVTSTVSEFGSQTLNAFSGLFKSVVLSKKEEPKQLEVTVETKDNNKINESKTEVECEHDDAGKNCDVDIEKVIRNESQSADVTTEVKTVPDDSNVDGKGASEIETISDDVLSSENVISQEDEKVVDDKTMKPEDSSDNLFTGFFKRFKK